MADGNNQQYDTSQLDTVQHPVLGPLKFPKDMPFEERNQHIEQMLAARPPKTPEAQPGAFQARKGGPILNANDSALHTGVRGLESTLGSLGEHGESPNTIGEAYGNAAKSLGRLGWETLKDPFTPIHGLATGIEESAKDIEAGLPKWPVMGFGGVRYANPGGHPGEGIGTQSIAQGIGATAGSRLAAEAVGRPIEAAAERIVPGALGRVTPSSRQARSLEKATKEMRTAAPPTRSEIDYNKAAKGAAPFLAEQQREQPIPKGKEAVRGSFEAANAAVKRIEAKTAEYAAALPDETLSRQEILDRVRQKLSDPNSPRTPREIEAGVEAAAEFLPRDLNLAEADRLRWRMNRDTASEMGMTEADRADVRASNPRFAAKEELGNALRDGFYGRLEDRGISGVRELREGEGNVLQMRDAFRRNINRSENPNPPSAFRRLGVFGPVGLGFLGETMASRLGLPPGVSAAAGLGTAGIYEYLRNRMTPGPMMERAFGRLGRSRLAPTYPEVRPQPPAETIGTPIEPPSPVEPPAGQPGGVNEPVTRQPEGLAMREQHGPLFRQGAVGEPIEVRETQPNIFESAGGEEPEVERLIRGPVRETPGPTREEIEGAQERKEREEAEKRVEEQGIVGKGKAERRAAAEEPPEEPVEEVKIKGITAEEPKPVRAKREAIPDPRKLYSPETITDAEGLLASEAGAMLSGERPGSYYDEYTEENRPLKQNQEFRQGERAGGKWRGVKSGRDMYPFMREHPDWSPSSIQKALDNKDSALYKRAISAAVDFIRQETQAEREAIQKENEASIAGEPIFPGMGEHVLGQEQGAARVKAEDLERQMNTPRNIEGIAGQIETKSPLFRGTAASPQNEMFGQPIEPTPRPEAEGKETYWKGDRATYTGNTKEIAGGLFYELKLEEGHLKGESKWTQKPPAQ